MAEGVQTAAFEGGVLRLLDSGLKAREAVLALPLSRLIVKMVRVPEENRGDPAAFATPILQAMSPYPDEPLTVSCEAVRESERGLVVLAAALPESAADDIGAALELAVRFDKPTFCFKFAGAHALAFLRHDPQHHLRFGHFQSGCLGK